VVGWLDLDCEALHDPDRDQWVVLYTAPPGTPSHEALRLLRVVGTQDLATRAPVWPGLSGPELFRPGPADLTWRGDPESPRTR
jgi:hypothetical protein